MTIKWARVLLQFPVTFDRDGDAVLYELLEKSPFHIRFDDTAGEIDGQRVLKADNGAVGALGIRDSHINIEALQIGLHIVRNADCAHVGQTGRGIFVLHPLVKLPDDKSFKNSGTIRIRGLRCVEAFVVMSPRRNLLLI